MTNWKTVSGGCQCGAVRYDIVARPLTAYVCHCTECQKQSASAFGVSLTVPKAALQIKQGNIKTWSRPASRGSQVTCSFCPACGTRLCHERPDAADVFSVKGGTLDDPRWLNPAGHIWLKSAQPWVRAWIDTLDTLKYPGQPPDKSELIARWQPC